MIPPKETFLKGPHRETLEKWATSVPGEAARDAAILQFVHELHTPIDPSKSWDQGSQLAGAKRILDILYNLWAKEEQTKAMRLPSLKPPS